MERVGSISRRVLARLVAANDNLEWKVPGPTPSNPPRLGRPRGGKPVDSEDEKVAGSDVGSPRPGWERATQPANVEDG